MYSCHLQFYLAGSSCREFQTIKEITPLECFTHTFSESVAVKNALAAKADVIFANLRGTDGQKMLLPLNAAKQADAQLILLADKEQVSALTDKLDAVTDLWMAPMEDEETRFRFRRWQEICKQSKDLWQISQYLETTINSIPSLIWYKDKEGIHQKVNDSFCALVNKSKAQVEGRDHCYIWDVGPEEALVCAKSDMKVMEEKKTCIAEEAVESSDGTKLLTTYKSPLFDLDGSVMGTVGVGIDITQEKAYEQEILKRSNTLESIFTSLECGILCHTIDGSRILSINAAALRILGYDSLEDMEAAGFHMIAKSVLDEDKPKLRACIESLEKEGDSSPIEYRVLHTDGDILHVIGNVKLIRENGELCYQRFLLDFTAQKIQQEKNERYQKELVQALSIDYNLVCYFDLDTGEGLTLRVDREKNSLLNDIFSGDIAFQDSMEQYIQTLVYEPDQRMIRQKLSQGSLIKELEEKQSLYINYRTFHNNEIKYYEIKIARGDSLGQNHSIVLGIRNVDGETRQEMEQKKLLEDSLRQANHANKAKSIFLSNMSHDIRTPMNAIIGFTNLAIAHKDDSERVNEYLEKIQMSENHMLGLINDTLDMSRIESGKMQLEKAACSLSEILRELNNIVQTDVQKKQLKLSINTDGVQNDNIYCDKMRLNQVLLNVLSNSVKYTHEGGRITLTVTETPGVSKDYANYDFFIKDTGIGISPEFLAHIFESFERENNTTISGIEGTGLGMAITKNIVDMMNGSITVDSEQGVGTEVKISLTFQLSDQVQEKQKIVPQVPHHGRILLVEDNQINQEIALAFLEDEGYEAEVANNGQVAVDMLKKSEPGYYSLILMDIQMPVMNGFEAARAIRKLKNKELASTPILAMTANAFEEDKREALRNGMNGFISKPINVEELYMAINNFLS